MSVKQYFTQPCRDDGFGGHYQSIIYTILYAEKHGGEYVYSKPNFVNIYGEENQEYLENIMNLSKNYKTVEEVGKENVIQVSVEFIISTIDQNIDYYFTNSAELKKIRDCFKENKNLDIIQNKLVTESEDKVVNIAIHIRRPNNLTYDLGSSLQDVDFNDLPSISNRFIHDDYYMFVIDNFRKTNSDKKLKFHIISEGEIEKFAKYNQEDTEIHLNESIETTFIRMIMADYLVLSASSFSYSAALLNENNIVYKDFWHPKLKTWKTIET